MFESALVKVVKEMMANVKSSDFVDKASLMLGDGWTFTSLMTTCRPCRVGSRTSTPFRWSTDIKNVFWDYVNVVEFLISSGHLPPHIGIVWWARHNNNINNNNYNNNNNNNNMPNLDVVHSHRLHYHQYADVLCCISLHLFQQLSATFCPSLRALMLGLMPNCWSQHNWGGYLLWNKATVGFSWQHSIGGIDIACANVSFSTLWSCLTSHLKQHCHSTTTFSTSFKSGCDESSSCIKDKGKGTRNQHCSLAALQPWGRCSSHSSLSLVMWAVGHTSPTYCRYLPGI